jgi:hypothetical protein
MAVTGPRATWLLQQHLLQPLPEPTQTAADKLYIQTAIQLCDGLEKRCSTFTSDHREKR